MDVELHKVGLYLINANITDIRDASGYIAALGQEAAARAINDAMIKVAEETRRGEIGKAEALRDQTVQVAMANAAAVEGNNEAQMKLADSNARLKVRQAEAQRIALVAEKEQAAKAEEAGYIANREAEMKRAELERATQTANEIVAAEIQKRKQEIAAEAIAAVLVKEQEGKAQALVIANKAEGDAALELAKGEAEALLLKKKAEGEGLEMVGRGQAAAIKCFIANGGYIVGNRNAFQAGTFLKRLICYICQAFRQRDACQCRAMIEGIGVNIGDAFRDRNGR